jgi:hypothetical protein
MTSCEPIVCLVFASKVDHAHRPTEPGDVGDTSRIVMVGLVLSDAKERLDRMAWNSFNSQPALRRFLARGIAKVPVSIPIEKGQPDVTVATKSRTRRAHVGTIASESSTPSSSVTQTCDPGGARRAMENSGHLIYCFTCWPVQQGGGQERPSGAAQPSCDRVTRKVDTKPNPAECNHPGQRNCPTKGCQTNVAALTPRC